MIEFINTDLGYNNYTALENFSCKIEDGEIVTFFGPSGCGKSTIIKNILGILNPLKGKVLIDSCSADKYGNKIAYTPQDNQLLPWLSVRENIKMWQDDSIANGEVKTFNIDHILELVQLSERGNAMINELSGGMARRTALARTMATSSSIMCLDEALVAVERKFRRKVMISLRNHLKKNKITCVIISHDFEEAIFMSDRVFVLSPSPAEIINTLELREDPYRLPEELRDDKLFEQESFHEACRALVN